MDTTPELRRPDPRPTRRILFLTGIAVVAITATLLIGTRPGPATGPSGSPAAAGTPTSPAHVPSAEPGDTPEPTPDEAWGPLALEPIVAVASLKPVAADAAGVRADTRFVLESLTTEPAGALATRLEVAPKIALKTIAGADARQVTLTPAAPLAAGTVYRFTLRRQDGSLAGTWGFRVRGPLRVVGTLPSDRTTGVPVNTGVEITFDQEDAADIRSYFSIEPAVEGRFERHGRTQVFVPSSLKASTLYTVTIKAGVPRTGTDLKLERDVVFRFETTGTQGSAIRWIVGRDVLEASPAEAPIVGLTARGIMNENGELQGVPDTVDLKVYKFESEASAIGALQAFLAAPRWTEFSSPTLPVAQLPLAVRFTATLEPIPSPYGEGISDWAVRFPARLDRGWYAVEVGGSRPAYAFLQVTRVSAWVSVLTDRTILWVNDVVAHQPIDGATAALAGKAAFGTSRADGILNAATPSALLPAAASAPDASAASLYAIGAGGGSETNAGAPAPIVVVHAGRDALLVAFDVGSNAGIYRGEWWENWYSGDETYWSLLFTDRWQYRTTDTVAIWGYLRTRDGNAVPGSVDVRIIPYEQTDPVQAPALARTRVEPNGTGVFSTTLSIERAELGGYLVAAIVDGRVVASQGIDVTVIRKPEYQLGVATDHLAVIAGTKVRLTATASFFDGTPAPGIPLRFGSNEQVFGPTDAGGAASVDWLAEASENAEEGSDRWLYVDPTGPETGEIYGNATVVVFPAAEQLDASGAVASGRLRVTARLRAVDLAAVERQLAAGDWNGDPGGRAIGGRRVAVTVTELVPVRTKIGTRYDFIEKVTVPIYRYDITRKVIRTTAIVSESDGRLVLDMAVTAPVHEYEVRFATKDAAGRNVIRTITAGTPVDESWSDETTFTLASGADTWDEGYAVGDAIAWTMRSNGTVLPSSEPNRYLYIVAQRGLVSVATSDAPKFTRTFRAADAPGLFIMGVRFTGTSYAPKAASWADIDLASRRIAVTVTSDRERYRPGDEITLRVRTLDETGRPIATDVVLQAVDEKLYAMGAAHTPDPLGQLHRRVDSGVVRLTSTHQVPIAAPGEGEGGAGGGDGPRTDFRDMLAFVRLRTNADGVATTTITASDDLTSWHVSASAMTADLHAGVGELLVPVGLPLFASVTVADEYLVTDHPSVRVRAFGLDLRPGDAVAFTVSSPSLGMPSTTITSTAFAGAWVDLPALRLGRQSLDVSVVAPNRKDASGKPLTDRLIVTFDVVSSRLTVARTAYGQVGGQLPAVPAGLASTYTFTDAGRGRYLPVLEDLIASTSVRLDRVLAATLARSMLEDAYRIDAATLPPGAIDPWRYEVHGPTDAETVDMPLAEWEELGIALMPYGGADPWLTARVAIADPRYAESRGIRWLLEAIRNDETQPRDLRVAAVAGLASLGLPVLADVLALRAETDLTIFESINLGLATAALGDEVAAREVEQVLLAAHGQRLGPWVRLNAGTDRDDVPEMTALLAVLAARVGDPLAPAMLDYVRAHPSAETSHALEAAATVSALLDRTPATATSFAYTVDGRRTVVDVKAGASVVISLTGPQGASLTLERLSGDVGVALSWREAANVAALTLDPAILLGRTAPTVTPAGQLVTVNLRAGFTADALDSGCYAVVEQVPSGLIPLIGAIAQDPDPNLNLIWPSEVVGQQVTFCVPHDDRINATTASLRYMARVVSTGTFTWEPAVMTIDGISEVVTVSGTATVRIDE